MLLEQAAELLLPVAGQAPGYRDGLPVPAPAAPRMTRPAASIKPPGRLWSCTPGWYAWTSRSAPSCCSGPLSGPCSWPPGGRPDYIILAALRRGRGADALGGRLCDQRFRRPGHRPAPWPVPGTARWPAAALAPHEALLVACVLAGAAFALAVLLLNSLTLRYALAAAAVLAASYPFMKRLHALPQGCILAWPLPAPCRWRTRPRPGSSPPPAAWLLFACLGALDRGLRHHVRHGRPRGRPQARREVHGPPVRCGRPAGGRADAGAGARRARARRAGLRGWAGPTMPRWAQAPACSSTSRR